MSDEEITDTVHDLGYRDDPPAASGVVDDADINAASRVPHVARSVVRRLLIQEAACPWCEAPAAPGDRFSCGTSSQARSEGCVQRLAGRLHERDEHLKRLRELFTCMGDPEVQPCPTADGTACPNCEVLARIEDDLARHPLGLRY
jgi:hypothetical protein